MKLFKSILTLTFFAGVLSLTSGCYYVVTGTAPGVFVRPMPYSPFSASPFPGGYNGNGAPANFQGGGGGSPRGFVSCAPPSGCSVTLPDKVLSPTEVAAIGTSKYGFNPDATAKLMEAYALAEKGDNETAAKNLGLTQAMAAEMKAGKISQDSANQIADTIGTSRESMWKYVQEINEASAAQNDSSSDNACPANSICG